MVPRPSPDGSESPASLINVGSDVRTLSKADRTNSKASLHSKSDAYCDKESINTLPRPSPDSSESPASLINVGSGDPAPSKADRENCKASLHSKSDARCDKESVNTLPRPSPDSSESPASLTNVGSEVRTLSKADRTNSKASLHSKSDAYCDKESVNTLPRSSPDSSGSAVSLITESDFRAPSKADSTKSEASLPSKADGCCDKESVNTPAESVITLADVHSLDDLSLGESSTIPTHYDPVCNQRSETAKNSLCKWAEASQTLIFLDWDDTLFPTSAIFHQWGLTSRMADWADMTLSDDQERLLEKWCDALEIYLKTTCSLSSHCVIVTNAKRPWIGACIDRFAPRLKPLFDREDGPQVVYAGEAAAVAQSGRRPGRSRLPTCGSPGNPARWIERLSPAEQRQELTNAKLAAMRQEANKFYSQHPNQTWKNIISVGDASYEHDAAKDLAFCRSAPEHERLRLKTIVTSEEPTIRDLTYRLRLATLLWPAHVHLDGDMNVDMNSPPERLQSFADGLKMPELHSLIRSGPISEEDEEAMENEFDEVVMAVHERVYQ